MAQNKNPTHLISHANPINLTPQSTANNLLKATNPSVNYSSANRTFGGKSSSSYSTQVFGVKGTSKSLASSVYLNKAYLQFPKPQKALAVLKKLQNTNLNSSVSTIGNGYFHRNIAYGELLNSNVAGPQK